MMEAFVLTYPAGTSFGRAAPSAGTVVSGSGGASGEAPAGPGERLWYGQEDGSDVSYAFTMPPGVNTIQVSGSAGGGGGGKGGGAATGSQYGGGGGGGGCWGKCIADRGMIVSDGKLTIETYGYGAGSKKGASWAVYDTADFTIQANGGDPGGIGAKNVGGAGGAGGKFLADEAQTTGTVLIDGSDGLAATTKAGAGGTGGAGGQGGTGGAGGEANLAGADGVIAGGGGGAGARTTGAAAAGGEGGGEGWVRIVWPPEE